MEQFLEFALGIFECGNDRQSAHSAMELAKNKFTCGIKAAIEKNRAEKGFKGICEGGGTVAATVDFFAATEDEMFAQAEMAGMFGKGATIDEFGAGFCERAFAKRGKILVELASENELKNSITQELEALVGLDWNTLFVGD